MSDVQIAELATLRKASQQIELRSPVTGFVLERNVSPGQRFEAGDELYVIADLSEVWILADMFQYEASAIRAGQVATVELPDQGRAFRARVSEVLPQFDPSSRTLEVRLETHNPRFVLRPDMFVDVEFPLQLPSSLSVPAEAVLDSGLRKTVFVDAGNRYFEARRVETGRRVGDRVEIRSGLMEGERVVTSGNFLLDSESRLKASAAGIRSEPAKDLVCGMDVDRDRARAAKRMTDLDGVEYFFCSDGCKQSFDAAPERFMSKPKGAPGPATVHNPDKTAQRDAPPPSSRGSHDADRAVAGGWPHGTSRRTAYIFPKISPNVVRCSWLPSMISSASRGRTVSDVSGADSSSPRCSATTLRPVREPMPESRSGRPASDGGTCTEKSSTPSPSNTGGYPRSSDITASIPSVV